MADPQTMRCPYCKGSGQREITPGYDRDCKTCAGSGRILSSRYVEPLSPVQLGPWLPVLGQLQGPWGWLSFYRGPYRTTHGGGYRYLDVQWGPGPEEGETYVQRVVNAADVTPLDRRNFKPVDEPALSPKQADHG